MVDSNGPSNKNEFSDVLFRILAAGALGLSAISGGYTVSTTDDRYRAADAERDLAVRDVQIQALRERVQRAEIDIDRIDRSGPATPNAAVLRLSQEIDKRLDKLERESARDHQRD